jgi:DNA-binding GntR family transcriptional regulator
MTKPESVFRVDRIAAPLRYSVTESIRNAIATGHFRAGDHLPERELCELTGVSRTLVREAMRQLESEGLIKVEPHRGPFVARLSREQAGGIYQVRMELESLACCLFAENATDAQRQALKAALEDLKAAARRPGAQKRLRAKNQFYDCLVEGAQNEALGICLYMLNSRITLLRSTSMSAPGRIKKSIAELSDLVEALMARDGQRASELARHHVTMAAEAALSQVGDNEDVLATSD